MYRMSVRSLRTLKSDYHWYSGCSLENSFIFFKGDEICSRGFTRRRLLLHLQRRNIGPIIHLHYHYVLSTLFYSPIQSNIHLTIIERLKIVVCQFWIDNACPGERERCSAHILGGAAPSQSLSLTLSWIILDCDIEIIITLRTYLSLTLSLIILDSDIDIEIIIVLDFDIEVILVIDNWFWLLGK